MTHKIYTFITLTFAAVLLFSCSWEEDDIFDASAAERLMQGAEKGTQRLISSPAGWAMEYYPTDDWEDPWGLGYLLLADYDSDGSVTMAMKNQFSSNVYLEDRSAWEVITDNGIVLTHNTWNDCIHAFCDPEDLTFTTDYTETGYGCEGDYEFIMVDLATSTDDPEYMMLKGKKRGIYIRLTRLEEGTDFQEYIEDVQAFTKKMFPSSAPNYLVMTIDGDDMQVEDMSTGIPNIFRLGGDAITEECYYPYLITRHNGKYYLRFRDEVISTNGYTIQELVYDEAQDAFIDVDNEDNIFTGPNPAEYFFAEIDDGSTWQFNRSSSMSDAFKAIVDEVYSQLSSMRYTLQNVRLTAGDDGEMNVTIYVRSSSGGSASAIYRCAATRSGDTLTLSYLAPYNTSSENVLGNAPAIQTLLDVLSTTLTISDSGTRFNLSTETLSDAAGTYWVVATLL